MFDELYKPLPELDPYLERINVKKSTDCTPEYLDELLIAHQYSVPFENLDIYDHNLVADISVEKLFDKIVFKKRGGYCFELNAMFCRLLKAIGYDAYPCLARVIEGDVTKVPSLHRLTLVNIDKDLYVCDVGFGGPQPCFALKVEDGFTKSSKAGVMQTFKIVKEDDWWTILYFSNDNWERTIQFLTEEKEEAEFAVPNFYCSKNENSLFVKSRVVNIKTETGNKTILDDTFIEIVNHERSETPINSSEERKELLKTHFGIDI